MLHHYEDIRSRIAEPPKWWDEEGVPRYCEFSPHEAANIYARQVALVEIACQACGERFLVAMSAGPFRADALAGEIERGVLHYGDPPNVGCCPAGATMNCDDLRVVEFWRNDATTGYEWQRFPDMERALDGLSPRPAVPTTTQREG